MTVVEVEPVTVDDVWDLAARPDALGRAALGWRAVAADARAARDALDRAAAPVVGGDWAGAAAEGYRAHYTRFAESLDRVARAGEETAVALDGAAALLRGGQDQLDREWARIAGAVRHRRGGGAVTFQPADRAQSDAVSAAIAGATAVRDDVERGLGRYAGALTGLRSDWLLLGSAWAGVASEADTEWTPPPPSGGGVDARLVGGLFVVQTGADDDEILVDGRHVVVDGKRLEIPAGARLVLRTGRGDDEVRVSGTAGVTVLAGDGDDRLFGGAGDDVLLSGAGQDTVRAGAGNDRVSLGPLETAATKPRDASGELADLGAGDDRLWGSLGSGTAYGGAGADLLFGGAGRDVLVGDAGDDTLSGGRDRDRLVGGDGDDAMFGGDDRDYLDGGAGNDRLDGGDGDDTLYGLGGADVLNGGAGADYLEGGEGDDRLTGGTGADVLSGGRGDDTLDGGAGDDVLYSGQGRDTVTGGAGTDTLYGEAGDAAAGVERTTAPGTGGDLTGFVTIDGDETYRERVRADLDLLAASPDGRAMLTSLRDSGVPLRIAEYESDNGFAMPGGEPYVLYNPEHDAAQGGTPPVVVLYHELAHVYDFDHGTFNDKPYNGASGIDRNGDGTVVPSSERQAVGLPIDDDGDPATPNRIDRHHPLGYTENGLRAEMGLASRDHYGGG